MSFAFEEVCALGFGVIREPLAVALRVLLASINLNRRIARVAKSGTQSAIPGVTNGQTQRSNF
jgi:hypothetical protein